MDTQVYILIYLNKTQNIFKELVNPRWWLIKGKLSVFKLHNKRGISLFAPELCEIKIISIRNVADIELREELNFAYI